MKKIFSSAIVVLFATFLYSGTLQAQKSVSSPIFRDADKNFSSEASNSGSIATNNKAIKSFNRKYKTSANVNWFNSGELIQAYFNENGKQYRVFYTPKGNWLRTIITYDKTHLAKWIKSLIYRNFRKFEVTWVHEVHEGSMDCYFINLETATEIKQVIVYDGEAVVHREYAKR